MYNVAVYKVGSFVILYVLGIYTQNVLNLWMQILFDCLKRALECF